jgi:NADPH-dependent glutamate synthase beta subunit-like oxidoreductase/NAD-dependent dihydropyrimidine dehydrogenase PreA subunit
MANSGVKVYLVERASAIGGKMVQLDKTFPTNDCAMCISSPKLVDAGRHPNIELLTQAELTRLEGEKGHFTATVRLNPRFIDLDKCTSCGDCAEVCPIVLPNPFNAHLDDRRAAYKMYPQAMPNAYAIFKRGISPCRDACPANQRAQGYIALIREERYEDALRVIKEDNPFPAICGRICNHRCEDACSRGKVDEPLSIASLKRFVTDTVYAQPRQPVEPVPQTHQERVAIVGSGPAGLTCAQDLAKQGYGVTVFEALPVAGGMLRVGIPEFRLPARVVEREIQDILDLGVELELNRRVENVNDLLKDGPDSPGEFDAVFVAVGAHTGRKLRIPGSDLPGTMVSTEFLRDVRLGKAPDVGEKVVVIGGGSVALDSARTAVRLGAKEVRVTCLEPCAEMPCHSWDIEEAQKEGIEICDARTMLEIVQEDGRATGVRCVQIDFRGFVDGRPDFDAIPNSQHVLPADTVIFSIGQGADLSLIPEGDTIGVTRRRTIEVDPNTMATGKPGVFAAGDVVTSTAFVIEAVAAGHHVAESIHRYLRGEKALDAAPKPELPVVELNLSKSNSA